MLTELLDYALYCITEYEIAINAGEIEDALVWEEAAEFALKQARDWEGFDCYAGTHKDLIEYHFGDSYRIEATFQ